MLRTLAFVWQQAQIAQSPYLHKPFFANGDSPADDNKKIFSEEAVNSFFTKDLLVIISGSFEAVVCAARRILRAKNVRDQLVLLGAYGSQRLPTIRNKGRQHPLQVLSPGGT